MITSMFAPRLAPPPTLPRLPLVMEWTAQAGPRSLPRRRVRPHRPLPPRLTTEPGAGARFASLPVRSEAEGFDFSQVMARLCQDITRRVAPLQHLDLTRVLFTITQARSHRRHGLQAKVTPLRFRHGHLTEVRRGRLFQVQRYVVDGLDMLYLVTFCLPRFLNQTFEEKLVTIFHELYHISPACNGDLRRHQGPSCLDTSSQKCYDLQMLELAIELLKVRPAPELIGFLRLNFEQLHSCHGPVQGVAVPMPKLVLVE